MKLKLNIWLNLVLTHDGIINLIDLFERTLTKHKSFPHI
jgi:hypothetical protein